MIVQKLSYCEYWGYYWRVTSRHQIPGIFEWDKNLVNLIMDKCGIPPNAEILDLGCAGGDQARLFAQKDCRITGIDQVPNLIDYAKNVFKKEGLRGDFIVGDFRKIEYSSKFDLCVMLSGTFGFPAENEDRQLLERVHRSLNTDGKAFIDYLPVESYSKRSRSKTWQPIEGGYALSEEWYHVPTSTWRTQHTHILAEGRIIQAAEENGYGATGLCPP